MLEYVFKSIMCLLLGMFIATMFVAISTPTSYIETLRAQKRIHETILQEYNTEIEQAMMIAPHNKTRWQLRGDAQTYAQMELDNLTHTLGLPQYQLPAIVWRSDGTGAAGRTGCDVGRRRAYIIFDEILFLRNYNEFLRDIVPHEISHFVACIEHGNTLHGLIWEENMRHLGFAEPRNHITHRLNYTPVREMFQRLNQQGITNQMVVDFL